MSTPTQKFKQKRTEMQKRKSTVPKRKSTKPGRKSSYAKAVEIIKKWEKKLEDIEEKRLDAYNKFLKEKDEKKKAKLDRYVKYLEGDIDIIKTHLTNHYVMKEKRGKEAVRRLLG